MDRHQEMQRTHQSTENSGIFATLRSTIESKWGRPIALTTALAAGSLALTACSGDAEAAPHPVVSQVAEETPTPEATSTPTPTPVETTEPAPTIDAETLSKFRGYDRLTGDEFSQLPKPEQQAWWMWKSEGLVEYADGWYEFSKKPEDKYPETISVDNTAQEISTIQGYQLRYILTLEPDERENALIAVLWQGKASPVYNTWMNYYAQIPISITNPRVAASEDTLPIPDAPSFNDGTSTIEDGVIVRNVHDNISNHDTNMFFVSDGINPITNEPEPSWYRQ